MTDQVGLLGLVVIAAVVVSLSAERMWKIRVEVALAVFGGLTMVAAFGAGPVILVGMFLLSATALGTWLTLGLPGASSPPLVFVTVFGAAIYAVVFTLIGAIPINTLALHSVLLVAPFLCALASPRTRLALWAHAEAFVHRAQEPEHRTAAEIVGLTAFTLVAQLHLWLCALPERYWDAMVFHLYLPSYVSAHGAWSYDASLHALAFVPNAVDWLYAHFFLLGGEVATRLYNFAALMLLCASLYVIVARITSREVAIWTAALFASIPLAFIESSSLFIETTLALWITSAVGLICVANLRPDARVTVMALTLLAVATMSKLHGAISAVVTAPVLLGLFLRGRPPRGNIVQVFVLAIVIAAVGCFPYAYSWLKTGNPIFPFYNDVFKSSFFPAYRFHDTRWEGNFNWSLLYDTTFASPRFGEVGTGALGLTIIIMVPLAMAAVIARPDARALVCLGSAAAVTLLIGSQIQYLRYFYPIFPLLLVASAIGLMLLFEGRRARVLTLVLVFAVVVFNIYKLPAGGWILSDFDLRAGFSPAARRSLELAQAPERLANKLINDTAGGTARVLYTGNPYGGLLQGQALYLEWYNQKLAGEMNDVTTPEQVQELLKRWAVTHVVAMSNGTTPGSKALHAYLQANYCPLAEFGPLSVYDIRKTPSKTP